MENNKPISLVMDELKGNIVNVINDSKLPICIVEPILKDIYEQISSLAKVQLEQDKKEYSEAQKEEAKEEV